MQLWTGPIDCHLFTILKDFWGGKHCENEEDLQKTVITCLSGLAVKEYDVGIQNIPDDTMNAKIYKPTT